MSFEVQNFKLLSFPNMLYECAYETWSSLVFKPLHKLSTVYSNFLLTNASQIAE